MVDQLQQLSEVLKYTLSADKAERKNGNSFDLFFCYTCTINVFLCPSTVLPPIGYFCQKNYTLRAISDRELMFLFFVYVY